MSYAVRQYPVDLPRQMGCLGCQPLGAVNPDGLGGFADENPAAFAVLAVAGIGIFGYILYQAFQSEMRIRESVAKKSGVGGLLALEGGEALIGSLSRRYSSNRRRHRRGKK